VPTFFDTAWILTDHGWESFTPSLPEPIAGHCMILLNATTAMVIAGGNTNYLAKTYLISDGNRVNYTFCISINEGVINFVYFLDITV
jgi:hypothetical protein